MEGESFHLPKMHGMARARPEAEADRQEPGLAQLPPKSALGGSWSHAAKCVVRFLKSLVLLFTAAPATMNR